MGRNAWAQWTGTSSGLVVPEEKSLQPVQDAPVRLEAKTDGATDWKDDRGREWKVSPGSATLGTDDETHTCLAIISLTGIMDRVDDIILPGAYAETLKTRTPKIIHAHDWAKPIGKCLQVAELLPGDDKLPTALPDGSAWPPGAGALVARILFNVNTREGKDGWENVRFYGPDQEWSIGYNARNAKRDQAGVRRIPAMDLYEGSTVLWGAMPWARTMEVGAA